MGTMDTSWSSMRNFLGQRGVKEDIQNFDARRITPASRNAVEELLRARHESFDPKVAKHASQAVPPLVEWVRANVQYSYILQKIEPLEAEQNELKKCVLVQWLHVVLHGYLHVLAGAHADAWRSPSRS